MKDEKLVYITSKGKRYHYNSSCTYLKGKEPYPIPLEKAKHSVEGPCTLCARSMEKNEENNLETKNKDKKGNNNSKKIKKEKIKNNNINNKKDNNKFEIVNNEETPEKKNSEEGEMTDDENNININNKNNIFVNNINNNNNNNIPFTDNDLSNIMPNNEQFNMFNKDDFMKNNKKNNKKNNINKKNKTKNNEKLNNEDNNEKEKEDQKIIIDFNNKEKNNNNININNNFDSNDSNDNNNNIINNNNNEDNKSTKEENNDFIDSKEIQDEPLNNINKLQGNLKPKYKSNFVYRYKINWATQDIKSLVVTNQSAKLLYLKNLVGIDDSKDGNISILSEQKNINSNKPNNEDTGIYKGNFKFKLEINPLKDLIKPIQISVGFEIDYIDNTDINVVNEEEDNNKEDNGKKIKIGALYETLVVIRHFYIYKKTNKVHVLINISSGRFFVVGDEELENVNKGIFVDKSNSQILHLRNFCGIQLNQIKDVRPIFKFNKNDLQFAEININGHKLDNKQLNNMI